MGVFEKMDVEVLVVPAHCVIGFSNDWVAKSIMRSVNQGSKARS